MYYSAVSPTQLFKSGLGPGLEVSPTHFDSEPGIVHTAVKLPTDMAEANGVGHLDNLSDPDWDSDVENVPQTKRRKLHHLYVRIREFKTLDSAKVHVKAEGTHKTEAAHDSVG